MPGSEHAGERDVAGLAIENKRKASGMTWQQIFGIED
jgi:hypothetical protein